MSTVIREQAAGLDYVGQCPECKRVVAAFINSPERRKDIAKEVAKWIKWGLNVIRMKTEDVRAAEWCHTKDCQFAPSGAPRR